MSDIPIVPYVVPKNSLRTSLHKSDIVSKIIKRVQEFPEYRNYKDDLETLLFICILVEHLVINKKNKEKIDKKEIVLDVYDKCFGNGIVKEVVAKNIQFLYDNNRIKKVSYTQYFCGSLSDWFNRKIALMYGNINDYIRTQIINYILKKIGIKKDFSIIFTCLNTIEITNILETTALTIGVNKHLFLLIYFIFIV